MSLIEKAKTFARMAHKGQKRFNGGDYFDCHCLVVGDYVLNNIHNIIPKCSWKYCLQPEVFDCIVSAGYLHDVLEDTKYNLDDFPLIVRGIVQSLTRKKNENYFDYILSINDVGSRAIKIADLRCNMSDLKEGSMKDKYRFAEYILLEQIRKENNGS